MSSLLTKQSLGQHILVAIEPVAITDTERCEELQHFMHSKQQSG